MSEGRKYPPHVSYMTFHDGDKITVQRDLEHGCIDIVIVGSHEYSTTKITVFPYYRDNSPPTVTMLDDHVKEEELVDE